MDDPWTGTKGGGMLEGGRCRVEENKGEERRGQL